MADPTPAAQPVHVYGLTLPAAAAQAAPGGLVLSMAIDGGPPQHSTAADGMEVRIPEGSTAVFYLTAFSIAGRPSEPGPPLTLSAGPAPDRPAAPTLTFRRIESPTAAGTNPPAG